MRNFQNERLVMGAMAIGEASKALELTLEYVQQRKTFGSTIYEKQAVRQRLAELAGKVEAGRQLLYHAAWLDAQNRDCVKEVSMVKAYCGELVNEVIEVAFLIQADGLARRAGEPASAELRTLEEAYACLRDANRRSQYDRRLKTRTVLGGSRTPGGVRRQRTCWGCQGVLDPFAAYCSGCHWIICGACSSCGCQHPTHRVRSRCAMIHPIWLRIALSRPDRLLAGVVLVDGLAIAALTLFSRALFG